MNEVSIVMPVYNISTYSESFSKKIDRIAIDDIIREIIFVEDCSADDSISVLEKLAKKYPDKVILYENSKNSGPAYCRNIGLTIAKAEYIAFLDSDDDWHPQKCFLQVELMKKTGIQISGTIHDTINENDYSRIQEINYKIEDLSVKKIKWPGVLFRSPFCTPSVILHKSIIDIFKFDEELRYSEDFNMWLRIIKSYNAVKILVPLTFTFKHDYLSNGGSLSSNLPAMEKGEIQSFRKLLRMENTSKTDKVLIILAIYFSYIKYIKRQINNKILRLRTN